ncbi:acyltransferase family protein [Bacillus wiedmannii]|uniref:acyltransferase family protein n=1 Tax=Bacillus wiedmannii TaxID=1890302 RepID=UPI000BF4362E|nr:acyltransferase [Bacillus wiedmannii]PFZ48089.1 hypothetical protein COL58_16825 [Bacillus wiedmannii]
MRFQNKRIFGLDLVRSMAIVLVLLAHGLGFFLTPGLNETKVGRIIIYSFHFPLGFFGVELFFVLSGFLIGGIIIKELVEKGNWINLLNFYIRRWFRTLPLYFLVVLFLVWFPMEKGFSWGNLFFIQNFNDDALLFNPVSWSLAVEEWFYLIIPFVMLLVFQFIKEDKGKYFIGICVFVMGISLLARIVFVLFQDPGFDFGTRKQIFFRLDSIIAGVILAGIKYYFQDLYKKMVTKRKLLFLIALIGFCACEIWFVIHRDMVSLDKSLFSRTFFFDIVTISCVLLVVSLENVKRPKVNIIGNIITFVSVMSYGLYLLHYRIYVFFKNTVSISSISIGGLVFVVATVVTIILATIIYWYYELPIMNLRDKFKLSRSDSKADSKKYITN